MKRGMLSLVLVLLAAGALWARGSDTAPLPQDENEKFVWMGSQRGSYMGVHTSDVTPDRVAPLKLKDESGVEVVGVDQDAPAGKAGIKEHDVIVTLNGQKVESEEQLRRMVHEIPPGRQVTVGLMRLGQPLTIQLTLADRAKVMKQHMSWDTTDAMVPPMPPMPPDVDIPNISVMVQSTTRTGLLVENLTPQLAEFFGVKGGRGGVLVRSVEKGSVADGAGFRAGDVIVTVDKEKVADMGDFRRALRGRSGATPITVLRDKKEQTLTVKLPDRQRGDVRWDNFDNLNVDVDLAALQPMIEKQQQIAMKLNEKTMKDLQKQMEKMSKDIEKSMKDLKFNFDFNTDEQ